jgi:putative transposase
VLDVHQSGFYAWLKQPHSKAYQTSQRQSGLIKQSWLESGGVYGYRKVHSDLRAWGEHIGINRVYKLMHQHGLKALVGYRKPRHYSLMLPRPTR